jgi:adenine specific DNA methylase Mod
LNIEDLSKQELLDLIKVYQSRKKYGLVWEDEINKERFSANPITALPILEEITKLRIENDTNDNYNYLIEGDNFHVLKILNYTHYNSIDIIYIDPPYNTGNKDFKYNDSFVAKEDSYRHSKWLNFMHKRLVLAKELMKDDGLIFISIDDNEFATLQVLADDIFGESNRLGPLIWYYEGVNDNNAFVKKTHEYILVYEKVSGAALSKNVRDLNVSLEDNIENSVVKNGPKNPPSRITLPVGFPCVSIKGRIKKQDVTSLKAYSDFVIENSRLVAPVDVESGWSSKTILTNFIKNNFEPVLDSKGQQTKFVINPSGNISYIKQRDQSYVISVLRGLGTVAGAGAELKDKGINFDYPKPVGLIKYLLQFHANKDAVVLDFFAGSGTTGEAVVQLNIDDEGTRKFILVTNNEGNICHEVTYPRLSKVMNGFTNSSSKKIPGIGGNLNFFRTNFLKKTLNTD